MRIEEKTETVTVTKRTYISNDDQPFDSESECLNHEKHVAIEKILKEIEPLYVYKDDYVPCNGGENQENHLYSWFKVNNQEELDKINEVFNTDAIIESFPEYINIERYDETDFDGYWATLTGCKEYVEKFFREGFGIEVSFDKIKETN